MKPLDGTETDEDPRDRAPGDRAPGDRAPGGRLVWAVVPGWILTGSVYQPDLSPLALTV